MSEPVGNSPRGSIPGNSHKSREGRAASEAPKQTNEPEKVEKIIEGKVVTRKTPFFKRAKRSIVAEDAHSVGGFIVSMVVVPHLKRLLFETISQGAERTLFGTSSARPGVLSSSATPSSALKLKQQYHRSINEPERVLTQDARARHDFDQIVLESRVEAIEVIEYLVARVAQYNRASVADLYDACGVTGSWADREYGWTNLDEADVRQVRGGFLLDLPRPIPLR